MHSALQPANCRVNYTMPQWPHGRVSCDLVGDKTRQEDYIIPASLAD